MGGAANRLARVVERVPRGCGGAELGGMGAGPEDYRAGVASGAIQGHAELLKG